MNDPCKVFSFDRIFDKELLRLPAADLFQIAELSLVRGGEICEHRQLCDEITYAVSGKATVFYGDGQMTLTPRQVHFIRKGEVHRIVADEDENFHYYCIGFLPHTDEDCVGQFYRLLGEHSELVLNDEGSIRSVFDRLMNELFVNDAQSETMLNCYFCMMTVMLSRLLTAGENIPSVSTAVGSHAAYRVLKYIDKNYLHIEKVQDIADALSYSEYYLSHIFREKIGMTVKEYLMQKKVSTAAILLKTSNMTVGETAAHLGFSSLHSFGIAFRRYMGTSPTDFRRQFRAEKAGEAK